mgnify:FL=1
MPREFYRCDRVADAIQRELSVLINDSLRDPRVGMVSVTEVKVSRDLSNSKFFVSFISSNTKDQANNAISALNGATGYLRKLMAANMNLRVMPKITFIHDNSLAERQVMSELIDRAIAADSRDVLSEEP